MKKLTAKQQECQDMLLQNRSVDDVAREMVKRYSSDKSSCTKAFMLSYWREKISELICSGDLIA